MRRVVAGNGATNLVCALLGNLIDLNTTHADFRLSSICDDRDFFEGLVVEVKSRRSATAAGPIQIQAVDVVNRLAAGAAVDLRTGLLEALIATHIEHRRCEPR